jgi:hypothetical protein
MGTDLNASLAFSDSSGAQTEGSTITTGDFIVGGSGGASKTAVPAWAIVAIGVVAVLIFFGWLAKR